MAESSGDVLGVIGIDLGTTNSVISAVVHGSVRILVDADGNQLHPSVVSFMPTGERLVGHRARARRVIDPENTISSVKRIIGRAYHSVEAQHAIEQMPYQIVEGDNQEAIVMSRVGKLSVVDISATVLIYLRQIAESQLGMSVTHCVITVPANFSDSQREATRQAAQRAGMTVLRILNEPTAASLAYGQNRDIHQRIAVFDLGGGTFDMTLLAMRGDLYEVVATGGDPFLGGDDMDRELAGLLAEQFLKQHQLDVIEKPEARARLLWAAEEIKKQLTREEAASGTISDITRGAGGESLDLEFRITRAEFDELVSVLVDRAIDTAAEVLTSAQVTPENVDEIILVGGATMVPVVRRRVAVFFGREPLAGINPMQVVAAGAAIHAASLTGAAQAGLLMDVTPHSLGIATAGGYAEFLIDKNTPVPAEGTRVFSPARDGQTMIRIRICQGENREFEENTVLGELCLDNLSAAPRSEVKVEVSFLVDANGILKVSARDLLTDRDVRATLSVLGINPAEEAA
ncbi:MAG: Hsp70 family protein [Proteobacteria bacterium]|nr:Hsp70 family protein [Pseudomonadota bacterium]